ncbi:SMP-30/gluconolactonase/LRE family protein [Pontibacillus yanchengensis]|uniref:Regucalcin n=1 Tax=Pontibacillus yanchengensis Y32 TaxID=1385514 RepID=A0A0A2TBH8_9BACI|nr:SMP-30/gluconolactonase/LRE family protein [Pontibacillus yanchengensis]KGP72869.1 SMP-30/gluconolaconase/LRE domain protein [Pontibacillus yanchengensis Y32]
MNVELVVDAKATLGEGPSWDDRHQLLYWVDIEEGHVLAYDPFNQTNTKLPVNERVGFVVPTQHDDKGVVGLQSGLYFLNWDTGVLEFIDDPEHHLPNNRFNDGKCDPAGRLWVGTMDLDAKQGAASLYCVQPNHQITKKVNHVTISNGMAWSMDHSYMYYIDTPTKQVIRFNYDKDSGAIDQPTVVITIPNDSGSPDGMTIDEEGMLWIAYFHGGGVARWNPETGEQLAFIDVPAVNVTSCTFGGEDLDELYITTASKETSSEELQTYPNAGGLFKVKPGVKGAPTYQFNG